MDKSKSPTKGVLDAMSKMAPQQDTQNSQDSQNTPQIQLIIDGQEITDPDILNQVMALVSQEEASESPDQQAQEASGMSDADKQKLAEKIYNV